MSILNSPAASLKGVTSGSLVGPSPLRNALGTSLPGTAQSTNAPLPDNDSAAAGWGSGADGIADGSIGLHGLSTPRGSTYGSPAARSHRASVSGPSPLAMQPPMSPAGSQPPSTPLAAGGATPMGRTPRPTLLTPRSSHSHRASISGPLPTSPLAGSPHPSVSPTSPYPSASPTTPHGISPVSPLAGSRPGTPRSMSHLDPAAGGGDSDSEGSVASLLRTPRGVPLPSTPSDADGWASSPRSIRSVSSGSGRECL